MAKRFTDTAKWKKKWIRELNPEMKLFWFYLLDNCDHAGIWEVDIDLASFQTGVKFDESTILKTFNRKIVPFKDGKWFVPKFIEYQYGELNDNNRVHNVVIKILTKYDIYKHLNEAGMGRTRGVNDPKDIYKEKDKLKEKEKESKKSQLLSIQIQLIELQKDFKNKDVKVEFEKWQDYMSSHGKRYKNYVAAFRNWLRNDQFDKVEKKSLVDQFKKTPTGLFKAFCMKCGKSHYPNEYQIKQSSSCCGVDWLPNPKGN
tara:strand:- start:590 stop:1363 length:774 start_codon:yes stop_codon:yes gene_type:complete